MVRLVVFRRATFLALLLATGCRYSLGEPAPTPIAFVRPSPAGASERCDPSPEAIVPPGQTPPPTAEGELGLLDWRGDDRLAIDGYVAFAWSSDGEKLISASDDGVFIWSAATGVLERRIDLPSRIESPLRVFLSPDDQWIAFVAYMVREDTSRIDAPGLFLMRSSGEGGVQRFEKTGDQLSFSADSRRLGSLSQVWDLEKRTSTPVSPPKFQHETKFLPGHERALVFVPSGESPNQAVYPELRDMATGKVLHRFPLLDTSFEASISGDGKRLGLLQKGALSVYSTETFECVAFIPNVGKAHMAHLSHDGRRAVTEVLRCSVELSSDIKDMSWCPSPELTLWDLDTGEKLIQTPRGSGSGWVFTPDGEYLTGPETRLVDYIVRIRDGKELRFGSRIRSISPGSRRVLYDGKLGFEIAALDEKSPVPTFERAPKILARSSDGRLHVAAGADGRLRLESASSCLKLPIIVPTFGEPRSSYDYFSSGEDEIAFSPDGSSLFVVTSATSMSVRFRAYDTRTGDERWSIQADGRNGGRAQVLPLSNQVLFQGNNHPDLRRFNATTGAELPKGGMPRLLYYTPADGGGYTYEVRGHDGIRAAYLYHAVSGRDGTRLAMSSILADKCAFSIWDLRDPRGVDDRFPGCLSNPKALSPDEKWVAAGAEDHRTMLLALDHDETRTIEGMHEGKTTALVFTPSGQRLVHADELGNIVMADPWQGKIKGRARLSLDYAKALWVSPDGQTLVVDTARGMRVRFRIGTQAR